MHQKQYRFDLVVIVMLIILQLIFTYFFPVRFTESYQNVTVTQNFIFMNFETSQGESSMYFPLCLIIYGLTMLYLIGFKREHQTLIYGLGLVLLVKVHYVSELYSLAGHTFTRLSTQNFISLKVVADFQLKAQDLTLYILITLGVIKLALNIYERVLQHKTSLSNIKNEPTL